MDATTAAAVAALVVSVLAMTIATAQVLQQYLNTGQLIRICDSVVYGKMPGQGRRVWQYSQFRFRVVYSVPQVCLRPSLWKASLPQYVSYERGLLPLPDLRHKANLGAPLPGLFLGDGVKQTPGSVHIAVAGRPAGCPCAEWPNIPVPVTSSTTCTTATPTDALQIFLSFPCKFPCEILLPLLSWQG